MKSPLGVTYDQFQLHTTATIVNVYIPSVSSCPTGYTATIAHLLAIPNAIILGDLNGHDPLWYSSLQDKRGEDIANEIDNSNCGTLNLDIPTRWPPSSTPSSPDVSISSDSFITFMDWKVVKALSSDHLPIHITIEAEFEETDTPKMTFTNLAKADWVSFKAETEESFRKQTQPTNVSKAEKIFRKIVIEASKHCIQAGRRRKSKPGMSKITTNLIKQRDQLRTRNPNSVDINLLNQEISNQINKDKGEKWKEFLTTFNRHTNIKCLWQTVKALNGKPKQSPNSAIIFDDKQINKNKNIANRFNKMFTSVTRHTSNKVNRITTNRTKALTLNDAPILTVENVNQAIKSARSSKALGPDQITIFHLKNLGPNGIEYLTQLFNNSIRTCSIPDIYKTARIIPLLKPGKPENEAKSFRPISLLSPVVKVLEKCILSIISQHIQLTNHQHGFRQNHSTTTALVKLTTDIANGFNKKRPAHRTIIAALDLSKAFDMVNHDTLINDLHQTTMPRSIVRWLSNYLKGRMASTEFRNATSSSRIIRTGVPQGSVLSPSLFNLYVSKAPAPPNNVSIISYADDFTIYSTGPDVELLTKALNDYLPHLTSFFKERNLEISTQKSTVSLITPHTGQYNYHPQVKVNKQTLPLEHKPKILGLTLDTMFTFTQHHKTTTTKAIKRNNILKALTGTTWGQDKETIIQTYKAIGRSTLEYACPAWTPFTAQSNINRLQIVQNSALRTASGCHTMASTQHIHQECQMLNIQQHISLLSSQFLLQCQAQQHPCHNVVQQQPRDRNIKQTLQSKYADVIQAHIPPAVNITNEAIKTGIKSLHTETVHQAITEYHARILLNGWPPPTPPINNSEQMLPRQSRRVLAQLRSGFCYILNSYKSKLNNNIPDICPHCQILPDDVAHLFNCINNPTTFKLIDLWRKPNDVINWILQHRQL